MPRWIAMFGLVGGPLIFASAIALLFGAYEQDGALFILGSAVAASTAAVQLQTTLATARRGKRAPLLRSS